MEISSILCMALMFRYSFDWEEQAQENERAVEEVLEQGYRTADLVQGGNEVKLVGTDQMGDLIAKHILDHQACSRRLSVSASRFRKLRSAGGEIWGMLVPGLPGIVTKLLQIETGLATETATG